MRVRCERFLSKMGQERGAELESGPGGLTRRRDYLVLSVKVDPDPTRGIMSVLFLVLDDFGEPQWAPAAGFSVVSGRLASNWRARSNTSGELELAPAAWLIDGFWGNYYGEDPQAVRQSREIFDQELAAMEAEDSHGDRRAP